MTKVLVIIGTRPEAIKLAPVVRALKDSGKFLPFICCTGQHREMLRDAIRIFEIEPDLDLNLMRPDQSLAELSSRLLSGLDKVLVEQRPEWVIVQGDTTTTMVATLAAFYRGIPTAHVEAGLRTRNLQMPFPEEANRRITGLLASLHFAPTQAARENLLREGIPLEQIHVTGNTVVDALLWMVQKVTGDVRLMNDLKSAIPALSLCDSHNRRLVLVTSHRRENFGDGLKNICVALCRLAQRKDIEIVYPVHLNPCVYNPVHRALSGYRNIHLLKPLHYQHFVALMHRAYIVLTDSGGVQEEAPALGKPVLVMRDVTERAEAVELGMAELVGTDSERIVSKANQLLDDPAYYMRMSRPVFCYGDGRAAERIVDIIAKESAKCSTRKNV
ncbi:MAG: UDP-N-acetylglucosamine 2-epimerase (non-hydrolyzing) [Desulfosoma sp.]